MQSYFNVILFILAVSLSAQIPTVEHKHLRAIISYEFEEEKAQLFEDSIIIACPMKTVVWMPEEHIFVDSRETTYDILREYPVLEDDLGDKETYLDNSQFYASACKDESIDQEALVYDCDSIFIEYHKRNVDHPTYFARDSIHGYDKIYSQHIYTNESGNYEIILGIEMKCILYSHVDLLLREKDAFDKQINPQAPAHERCPFPEVSDTFVVLDEIVAYFQVEESQIDSLKLSKSRLEYVYMPITH